MTTTRLPPSEAGATGVVRRAAGVVAELRDVLWAARPATEKMDAVAAIEELKSQLDAIELDVVRDLEATGAVRPMGWASTKDFVTSIAGGHKGSGPGAVRLAQTLSESLYAPVAEALADGWLSVAKAHVIARSVDDLPIDTDVRSRGVLAMLEHAKALDATELRKVGRRLASVVDPDGEDRRSERALDREERAAHLGRFFTVSDDHGGGAWLRGRCSAEDAALIRSTLLPLSAPRPSIVPECRPEACDVPGCGHDGRDPREAGARTLDALVEACHRLQGADLLPDSHGARPRVAVTIDLDGLRHGLGFGVTETGEDLAPATVRRLACDADLIPVVLGTAGEVLDVGRAMRLASVAIWKALVARDRHCRFPGCTRPPVMCHAHHLTHWADGGETSLANLVLLCGHHHRLVHAGPWTVTTNGSKAFTFTPPDAVRRRGPQPHGPGRAPPDS